MKVRLQAQIDAKADHTLRNTAHEKAQSITAAIETAIKLYWYADNQTINDAQAAWEVETGPILT